MGSRSFSVGSYTRHIQEQEDPFNQRVMGILNDDVSELSPEDQLTADQIKTAGLLAQAEDRKTQDRIATGQNGDVFIAAHPEFIDSDANVALMKHELTRMFGECLYTLEHYETAYESLRGSNFLKLNQAEVAKQRKAADKARAEAERARRVPKSEDELYAMPLEDLRRLDAVENQQRMQREGETGGW